MISIKNLSKQYTSGVNALNNISFEAGKGEICGYIGTNGAGKSTTVKILAGMLDFNSGEVKVNGIDVKTDPIEVKKITGYIPETANLFNSLSPREFLKFIAEVRQIENKSFNSRLNNFAGLFEFTEYLDESIGNLSKGNIQKVLIASGLLHNPDVILFDEPLNGLDANSILVFQDLLSFLVSKGKTIFYCSHLLSTVEKISTKIILIDKGKIVLDERTSELKNTENYVDLENLFRNLKTESETKRYSYEGLFD